MRLLTRRLHRAFPELDRYTDEQCRRFMRSARRGRRLLFLAVWLVVVSSGLGVAAYFGDQLYEWSNNYQQDQRRDIAWLNVVTAMVLGGMLAAPFGVALLVRDAMMRRRVKVILTEDSSCPRCRYGLLGLAVEANSTIKCPECGYICEVDPSLSELTLDAEGKPQLRPVIVLPPPTPFMKRRGVRIALRVTVAAVLLLALCWAGWIGWLTGQVSDAKAKREEFGAALRAQVGSRLPVASAIQGDRYIDVAKLVAMVADVDRGFWISVNGGSTFGTSASLGAVLKRDGSVSEQLTIELVSVYWNAGIFERLADFQQSVPELYPAHLSPYSGAAMSPWMVKVLEMNTVRMELAREKKDWPDFVDALESNLAVARVLRHQDYSADLAGACDIEARTFGRVRAVLAEGPDQACVDAIQAAILRQRTELPAGPVFESERLAAQVRLSDQFAAMVGPNTSNIKMLSVLWGVRKFGARLGSYRENRECLDGYYKVFEATASQLPYQRLNLPAYAPSNLVMLMGVSDLRVMVVEKLDRNAMERGSIDVQLALERYRLKNGGYPSTLEELTPEFLATLPLDPWSGKPFGYKVVDASKEREGRPFLLYSCGFDKTDNGGAALPAGDPADLLRFQYSSGLGFDYIINAGPSVSKPTKASGAGGGP